MIRTILKPFSVLPALLLMCLIFNFSSQSGEESAHLSYGISCQIVRTVDHILGARLDERKIETWSDKIHGPIRKLAHMTEYFLLAIAVAFPLYVYGIRETRRLLITILICVLFACSDEFHQSFVANRSPSLRDVRIDSVGAICGAILTGIFEKILQK